MEQLHNSESCDTHGEHTSSQRTKVVDQTWGGGLPIKPHNLYKLSTKEDQYHIHKTLGIFSLLNYYYRFYLCWTTGSAGFSSSYSSLFCILAHMALSGTSLIFHIPNNRIRSKPMIWPEFRIHSILFAYRSFISMLLFWTEDYFELHWLRYYNPLINGAIVISIMVLADKTSDYYRRVGHIKPDDTTMRTMPFPDNTPSYVITGLNYYYSVCQLICTLTIVTALNYDRIFLVVYSIQLAALLMTMVRKNICTAGFWHASYAAALGINYVFGYYDTLYSDPSRHDLNKLFWVLVAYTIFARFILNMNKYVMWSTVTAVVMMVPHE